MSKRKITYSQLRKWEDHGTLNPHDLVIEISEKSLLDSLMASIGEEAKAETTPAMQVQPTQKHVILRKRSIVMKVFNTSASSLRSNKIPGVIWKGAPRNGVEAWCAIDLNHDYLKSFGLCESDFGGPNGFGPGRERFLTAKQVMKKFGFERENSVYSKFDKDEVLRIGRNVRYPDALAEEKASNIRGLGPRWYLETIHGGKQ